MRVVVAVALLFLASALVAEQASGQATAAPATAADGAPTVTAVRGREEVNFPYKGLTSYYTCDGIRDKVRRILKYIGAQPGFKVTVRSCINDAGSNRHLGGVGAHAMGLHHGGPAATRHAGAAGGDREAGSGRPELASRAQGEPSATAEATAQFAAQLSSASQFRGSPIGPVQHGDCELMEQLAEAAVPAQLGVKVVKDEMTCVPQRVTPEGLRITVEVLVPVTAQ